MNKNNFSSAIDLLKKLIAVPSFSREEIVTAVIISDFLKKQGIPVKQTGNNVLAYNQFFDPAKETLLLNSHHDTVKPNSAWTKDPFSAIVEDGKLFGLGSNDAGASLVSLLFCFLHFYSEKNLPVNLLFAATAEEEISGSGGIALILPDLKNINCAIVGEPTKMQMAIAEKGLLVLDCICYGKAGHAARDEGENAIYKAIEAINWFRPENYRNHFPEISEWLGEIKMSVTLIEAGKQHNIVPEQCRFTVDIRLTEKYSPEEIIETVRKHIATEVQPRSMRLRPSFIAGSHPLVKAGKSIGVNCFGSSTLSDQALMSFPSVKIGPGDSARSHTADEFIFLSEIENGIQNYICLLHSFFSEIKKQDLLQNKNYAK